MWKRELEREDNTLVMELMVIGLTPVLLGLLLVVFIVCVHQRNRQEWCLEKMHSIPDEQEDE